MKLYVNGAATTSRAVLAFCKAEKVPVEIISVDLMRGAHHEAEFAALNPNRLVPVLVDKDFVLTEASAILRYLAVKTKSSLYPEELRARARVDELIAWFEANFYKDFGFGYVYPQLFPHHARGSEEGTRQAIAWGRTKSQQWLAVLDGHYLGRGQLYLAGEQLSIADLLGVSIVSLGELVGCSFERYANVERWYRRIVALPSWTDINRTFEQFAATTRTRACVRLD